MNKISNSNYEGLGHFNKEKKASFIIETLNLPTAWEYIYQNRKILLKVDQFGPVHAQAYPPSDIMLFRRDSFQKSSNWLVWIKSPLFSGKNFCNFFRPNTKECRPDFEPQNVRITYSPEVATYYFEQDGIGVETELFVPLDSPSIIMKVTVTNNRKECIPISMVPAFLPYINPAMLAPWDKPEWYLKSGFGVEEEFVFWTQLLNMNSEKEKRRTVALWCNKEDLNSVEISYERFVGQGTFSDPEALYYDRLGKLPDDGGKWGEYNDKNAIYGYPPIYALQYDYLLAPGQSRSLTQVLSLLDNEPDYSFQNKLTAKKTIPFFDTKVYEFEKNKVHVFFNNLLKNRHIETPDNALNYYVNEWLPLQMYWVASLDRGWPSGMRGSRDSANDFTDMIPLDSLWSREILETLISCQRSDGWYPRQYSAFGRHGKHDLRKHVDAGVWVIEFLYEYLCYTKDYELLEKELEWLDCNTKDSIMRHAIKTMEFYLRDENLGEHGLCKIGEGDWLDSVNQAGLLGRGESVTVTNQVIIALTFMVSILKKIKKMRNDSLSNDRNDELINIYQAQRAILKDNIRKHAFNEKGYFNSVFNDNGKWLFSDNDPDGKQRVYGPANWYSISSGVAMPDLVDSALKTLDFLKCEMGYRLYTPPMGDTPIDKVGRSGSGDMPFGLWENGNVYNQGSHGFLGRALAIAGKGDLLYEVLQYLLPYDQEKHPTLKVMTPPYAIVNCWQQIPGFIHRGGLNFLTGSTAMGLRMVYSWMMGIKPLLDGLAIDPCIPACFNSIKVKFKYLDKIVELEIYNPDKRQVEPKDMLFNNIKIEKKVKCPFSGREMFTIDDDLFTEQVNKISVVL